MQKILFFLLLQMVLQELHALEIHQIRLSEISPTSINVSLDTEARELYYFQSWRSQISGNKITIDVFFIEGFGSTIAYLNNNFKISIAPGRMVYKLNVRIYYSNSTIFQNSGRLQDEWSGLFSTPLSAPIFLTNPIESNPLNFKFQNPNPGLINIGSQRMNVTICDDRGQFIEEKYIQESIDFSHLPDGLYYFKLEYDNYIKTIPIILKK